jgi:hypothetical protein
LIQTLNVRPRVNVETGGHGYRAETLSRDTIARGILKNSRSQSGSEQMLTEDGQVRVAEQYVVGS